ncbi:MAG: ribonuclease T2-like [Bathelium mastoideum]|nr:MAG: ribonuclease T2-like [Bathelium mastoideum]KAI9687956.1 MAG: ribonuclease T2-like [Bathelium mastoideum]
MRTLLILFTWATIALAGPPTCPANSPLSCSNTTNVPGTCCFESGGQVLQTQFWDTNPASGPADSWTIHGLWPDFCDGTYPQYCDESRQYTNISCILESYGKTDLLNYMYTYWTDDEGQDQEFWEHEWGKHGTCYSTLKPSCYTDYTPQEEVADFFQQVVNLFQGLNTYEFLKNASIVPTTTKNYTNAEVMNALRAARGVNATIECSDGQLDQVYYTFHVRGSIADGTFVAAEPVGEGNGCPQTFQYLPKDLSSAYPTNNTEKCNGTNATLSESHSIPAKRRFRFPTYLG